MPTLNQKGAVQFIVLIILLLGIAGGVFLATREEPFKIFPKASESTSKTTSELHSDFGKAAKFPNSTEPHMNIHFPGMFVPGTPGDISVLNPKGSMTLEMWVRLDEEISSKDISYLLYKLGQFDYSGSPTYAPLYYLQLTGNSILTCIKDTSKNVFGCARYSTSLKVGKWYHLAGVYEAENKRVSLYINGIRFGVGNATSTNPLIDDTLPLYIQGHPYTSSPRSLPVTIDEVRISNIARYTTSDFSLSWTPFTSDVNTVLLWHLDSIIMTEARGFQVTDESSYGNHGEAPSSMKLARSTIGKPPSTPGASRVFVTSSRYNGNLGGLSGADAKCQERADAEKLGGTWKAWLSDSTTSVASRFTHLFSPYKKLDGTVVADDWFDLTDDSLQSPIDITEKGVKKETVDKNVWTNTDTIGAIQTTEKLSSCDNWTMSDHVRDGRIGSSFYKDSHWTDLAGEAPLPENCIEENFLYCFEQTVTPSSTPIPTASPTPSPTSTPSPTPTPTPAPNPDLVVNNILVLGTPKVGRSNSLNVAVENKGDMEAKSDKGISIGVTITKPDGTSLGTCSTVINRSLKPQDKITVQIRNCPKYTVSGSHQITATIDSTKLISESNEDNNTLSTSIVVIR